MHFQALCRVCINEHSDMLSIFEPYNFSKEIREIFKVISDCASVQIQESDGFSKKICWRCLIHLSQAYSFKKLCEESYNTFRNHVIVTEEIVMKNESIEEGNEIHNVNTQDFVVTEVKQECCDDVITSITQKVEEDDTPIASSDEESDRRSIETKNEFIEEDTTINYGEIYNNNNADRNENTKTTDVALIDFKNARFNIKECEKQGAQDDANELVDVLITIEDSSDVNLDAAFSTKECEKQKAQDDATDLINVLITIENESDSDPNEAADCKNKELEKQKEEHAAPLKQQCNIETTNCDKKQGDSIIPALTKSQSLEEKIFSTNKDRRKMKQQDATECETPSSTNSNIFSEQCNKDIVHIDKYEAKESTESETSSHVNKSGSLKTTENMEIKDQASSPQLALKVPKITDCETKRPRIDDQDASNPEDTSKVPYNLKQCVLEAGRENKTDKDALNLQEMEKSQCAKIYIREQCTINGDTLKVKSDTSDLYTCNICRKSFTRKMYLARHMKIHTGERRHECSICSKKFLRSNSLTIHMLTHSGEKPYKCPYCNKGFSAKANELVHEMIHTGEKPFECKICARRFRLHNGLKIHMRYHTGDRRYVCEICGEKFAQSCNLASHVRIHTGEKPYKCDICEKKFTKNCSLMTHVRLHTGEKPYECKICEKTFRYRRDLVDHISLHTGEKLYKCGICKKKFVQAELPAHMDEHKGEQTFQCKECGAYLCNEKVLRVHEKIHTGENVFKCDICNKNLSTKYRLTTHLKTHTGKINVTFVSNNI